MVSEVLTFPTEELVNELEPFHNIFPVLISGKHYNRATREELLARADEWQLSPEDIELNTRDIARYKEYEDLLKRLAEESGITPEDIELSDAVFRKIKTIVTQEEKDQVKQFIEKIQKVTEKLDDYKDQFGDL